MKYQVIIPARGGSKRFPKKNIQFLDGIPLVSHSVQYALKYFPKDNIWVNTDDLAIASIATSYGVQITLRPSELGSDTATTADVLFYQQSVFEKEQIICDAMILLQATNPLRPGNLLVEALELFESSGRKSLASFSLLNRKYGKIESKRYFPKNYAPGQRMQDIEQDYYENGLIYITKKEAIKNREIITSDVFPYICKGIEASVDIDEPIDMLFADFLLKNKQIL